MKLEIPYRCNDPSDQGGSYFEHIMVLSVALGFLQTFQAPKMEESSPRYKLYGYGLCRGKPIPKIALEGSVPPFLVPETFGDKWVLYSTVTTPPKFNSEFTPEKCWGRRSFPFGVNSLGKNFQEGYTQLENKMLSTCSLAYNAKIVFFGGN